MYALTEYAVFAAVVVTLAILLFLLAIAVIAAEELATNLSVTARKRLRQARERMVTLHAYPVQAIIERFHPYIRT